MFVFWISVSIAILDQWTKQFVRWNFTLGESLPLIPGFFDFTYVRNTGAAWGILGGQNAVLSALSVFMLVFMIVFRRSFLGRVRTHHAAFGLLIGGIIGNLFDRLKLGWVTDFLDFHWQTHHFPAFNVADSAICIGVMLYLACSVWMSRRMTPSLSVTSPILDAGTHQNNDG